MIEGVLTELGVRITNVSDKEIQAFCPVHHLVEGAEQSAPKWYMNAETGAWICFTCGQRGSLPYLVEALGGDAATIEQLKLSAATTTASRWVRDGNDVAVEERVLVDPVLFDANPFPPERTMDNKDVDSHTCAQFNARWDAKGKCWLLPIYNFDGNLVGWQEKSKGYFMNVPKKVKKSDSLYGWHLYRGGQLIVVESPLDAMRFGTYGYRAVATYGSFVSAEQTEKITLAAQVILAFDNDDAGDHAMDQMAKALVERHSYVRKFRYPPGSRGYDPGELTPSQLHDGVARPLLAIPPPKENNHDQDSKPQRDGRRDRPLQGPVRSPAIRSGRSNRDTAPASRSVPRKRNVW